MKKIFSLLILVIAYTIGLSQDKNAEAKMHYTTAEEFFNKNTLLGAEECIEELTKAEESLQTTNPKILYLKIQAANKFSDFFYEYDKIMWLKKFFQITDVNTFPANKYADILKINTGSTENRVKDPDFDKKINDTNFFKEYPEFNPLYNPLYKYTSEGYYAHGKKFEQQSYILSNGSTSGDDLWKDEGYNKAETYFYLAADKGNLGAMKELSDMYYNGWGVIKNIKTSLDWALKAKDTLQVALLYNNHGKELITNGEEVIAWCMNVSNSKDSLTQQFASEAIGKIYHNGIGGITKDNYKAMECFIKAYNMGAEDGYEIDGIVIVDNYYEKDRATQKKIRNLYNDWVKTKRKK